MSSYVDKFHNFAGPEIFAGLTYRELCNRCRICDPDIGLFSFELIGRHKIMIHQNYSTVQTNNLFFNIDNSGQIITLSGYTLLFPCWLLNRCKKALIICHINLSIPYAGMSLPFFSLINLGLRTSCK